jgi:restriction endonuclease S subunit
MMSNFQLSAQADPNKIFLVKFSELEGRFDPHFHKLEFKNIENKINLSGFDVSKLKELFEINRGGSPRPINKYFTDDKNGINWIKIGDTKGIDKYIYKTKQKIKPEGLKFSRKVVEGDFLLSNSMSFGKPFIMKTTGCIHDGWLLFRPTTDKASKDYLHTILGTNFIYKMFKKQTIGGVVENLNIDLVKNIKIPIPPKNIQADIVAKMDKAYQDKKDKEAQAQNLLNSIDTYLLNELGIDLPRQTDNSLKARIFIKKFSDIAGGRFDAEYYQKQYIDINNSLSDCNFKYKPLYNISQIGSGSTPAKADYLDTKTDYPIIKVKSYEGDFISSNKLDFTYKAVEKYAKKDDIFILSSAHQANYVGRFIKFLDKIPPENTSFVGELICVRADKNICNPMYLFSLLNIEIYKTLLNREKRGQTSHIYPKDIKNINTPLPPLKKQNQIAEHISQIREQAKQLQTEAKLGLKQAKQEIETMILGEEL